jgi:hypothetical protein
MGEDKKYWIGVVSRQHIMRGVRDGFLQLNHGKKAPLKRFKKGDGIVIYSPREDYPYGERVQKFTAAGFIKSGEVYQVDMSEGFKPCRIDIDFIKCREVSIRSLLEKLSFTKNRKSWGIVFRAGYLEIPVEDFKTIISAMRENFE